MKFFIVTLFVSFIGLVSCSNNQGCDEIFTTSTFILDKKYCVSDYTYMKIDSIKDSRCPIDQICIWVGEAAVYLTWFDEDVYYKDTVTFKGGISGFQEFKELSFDGLKLIISEVGPYPNGDTVNEKDYYVKMKVAEE